MELSGEGGNGRSVTLPLDVHTSVECRLRRGEGGKDTFWPATIIERTQGSSDDPRVSSTATASLTAWGKRW